MGTRDYHSYGNTQRVKLPFVVTMKDLENSDVLKRRSMSQSFEQIAPSDDEDDAPESSSPKTKVSDPGDNGHLSRSLSHTGAASFEATTAHTSTASSFPESGTHYPSARSYTVTKEPGGIERGQSMMAAVSYTESQKPFKVLPHVSKDGGYDPMDYGYIVDASELPSARLPAEHSEGEAGDEHAEAPSSVDSTPTPAERATFPEGRHRYVNYKKNVPEKRRSDRRSGRGGSGASSGIFIELPPAEEPAPAKVPSPVAAPVEEVVSDHPSAPASDHDERSDNEKSDTDDEMRNFFPATREGFNEVAGKVTRVTRADFDDFNRRRHLDCFARSMDSWKNFERRAGHEPGDAKFTELDFDRFDDIFVNIDVNTLSPLDQFIYHLLSSSDKVMDQNELSNLMAKLRRQFHIAPSKREIFERLQQLQSTIELQPASASAEYNLPDVADIRVKGESGRKDKVKCDSKMQHLLRSKGTRSNSGVVVITVLTAPGNFSCSADCYYCPNEPGQPRSYLSTEPAVLRANQNEFDAVKQFYDRAMTLFKNGHVIDKIEILVLGGTWSGYPRNYQEEFCRDLYYAANIFPGEIASARQRKSLEEEQDLNEKGKCRIIGLTLETRPDRITPNEIKNLRSFGCTRVQLGIQHTSDEVLDYVNRGHTLNDTVRAIYLLKENCYKIDIHIMPDLPSSSPEKDIDMFATILGDEGLQADQWKIYPCEVTPFTEIEKWYKEGKYVPYFDTDSTLLTNLLMQVKRAVHPWIRLNRVIRDIPNPSIIAGTNVTNMRQLVLGDMKNRGIACHCIRCREVKMGNIGMDVKLMVRQYYTTGGNEYFLSYENQDESKIYGFLRMRLRANTSYNPKISVFRCLEDCAFIRELHVYGVVVPHGKTVKEKTPHQHRGIGASLLLAAEIVAAAKGFWKMAVIAGVGTREYYMKHGYQLEETYMTKVLSSESISLRFMCQKRLTSVASIRIPNSIKIHVIDLDSAVRKLYLQLPEADEPRFAPPVVYTPTAGENFSININRFLGFARSTNDATVDYTKENTIVFDEYLAYMDNAVDQMSGSMDFMQDRPIFLASVAFFGLVCLSKLRGGQRA